MAEIALGSTAAILALAAAVTELKLEEMKRQAVPGAPAPAVATKAGPPSSIAVVVGTPGYYTGARDAETKAQYNARMGSDAGKFGDLGWMLGTAPKV
jgi:hypothetical protein